MSEAKTIQQKFVAAWLSCENPELDGENPHYGNRYASLKSTLAAVRKACVPQGISYIQRFTVKDDSRSVLLSSVMDGDDEMTLSAFPVYTPENPQSVGSALTYAKCQQAQADWGITGEPDDDAEAAKPERGYATLKQGSAASSKPAPQVARRDRMLARCSELLGECFAAGMNEGFEKKYLDAHYRAFDAKELGEAELEEYGKYLAEMLEQAKRDLAKGE